MCEQFIHQWDNPTPSGCFWGFYDGPVIIVAYRLVNPNRSGIKVNIPPGKRRKLTAAAAGIEDSVSEYAESAAGRYLNPPDIFIGSDLSRVMYEAARGGYTPDRIEWNVAAAASITTVILKFACQIVVCAAGYDIPRLRKILCVHKS